MPSARDPVKIGRHTHPQAKAEPEPSSAPTGIDYLKLLTEKRDAEQAGHPIDYASLAEPEDGEGEGEDRDIDKQGHER